MSHNPDVVLLGSTQTSFKVVDNHKGTKAAGTAVRLKNDDTLSTTSTDGSLLGVSLGRSMSDDGYVSIVRKGTRVPLLLEDGFTAVIGAAVHISNSTGKGMASGGGATATAATYVSANLPEGGIDEDGNAVDDVALIDFPGGF